MAFQFEIVGIPKFYFSLSLSTIEALIKVSEKHYDMTCRHASLSYDKINGVPNGFIRIWHNQTSLGSPGFPVRLMASRTELGIALKCMEGADEATNLVLGELRTRFYRILAAAHVAAEWVYTEEDSK